MDDHTTSHTNGTKVGYYCGGGAAIGRSLSVLKFGSGNSKLYFGMDWGGGYDSRNPFKGPDISGLQKLNALLISHAHYDHCGMTPQVLRHFPNVRILATQATRDLCEFAWRSTLRFTQMRMVMEPFSQEEVDNTLERMEIIEYEKEVRLSDNVSFFGLDSGHILGSVSPLLIFNKEAFFMTSDICMRDRSLLKGAKIPNAQTRLLVRESTYINTSFKERQETINELVKIVVETNKRGGKVLIPALSIDRAQDIFMILHNAGVGNVHMDGARGPTNIYTEHLNNEVLASANRIENDDQRKKLANSNVPVVIIATSGMMLEETLSAFWAEKLAPSKNNSVIMVSYQDPGSQGGRFSNTPQGQFLVFSGRRQGILLKACETYSLNFSSHMSGPEGEELEANLNPDTIVYNHGSGGEISRYIESHNDGKKRIIAGVGKWYSV